jgi:hypothetical protein
MIGKWILRGFSIVLFFISMAFLYSVCLFALEEYIQFTWIGTVVAVMSIWTVLFGLFTAAAFWVDSNNQR